MSEDNTDASVDVVQAIWLLSQRLGVTLDDAASIYIRTMKAFQLASDRNKSAN